MLPILTRRAETGLANGWRSRWGTLRGSPKPPRWGARAGRAAAAAAGLALLAAPVAAQTGEAQKPAAAPSTALAKVAEALARALAQAPPRALVVAAPLTGDAAAPRGAQLAVALAAQVAGRRGSSSHARAEPLALAAAREAAHGDSVLVHLTPEIAGGKLRVTADVYPVPRSVWARIRNPAPGPIAHAFAEASIDAELRTYLAPVPLVTATVERAKNFEGDVVALACGDVDQDGAPEIVAVSRRRVSLLRLRGGRVQVLASRSWPELAPVAPAPLREAIGFASIVSPPGVPSFVDVGLTDRARSVRLDGELHTVTSFLGVAVPDGASSACTRLPGPVVTGPVAPCRPGDPSPFMPSIGGQYDAFASARLIARSGEPYVVWAGRERGGLEARDDAGHKTALDGIGAQLALGDIDQDGEPEILASLDTLSPLDDAVVVRSWSRGMAIPMGAGPSARLREVLRIPAPAGVHAIAVCPPDGPGAAPFVVATADELWVVRWS
jgi:hypothetical protein